jgi:hypothetical protein
MIITENELSLYAPTLVDNPNANNLIIVTQSLLESSCQRCLDLTEYQEIKKINRFNRNIFCSYFPISADPPLSIAVRYSSTTTSFGRKVSLSDWEILSDTQYVLDTNGTINILSGSGIGIPDEAKLIYTSGFDFTDITNQEIIKIKTLFGSLLEYTQSHYFKGIKKLDIDGEVSVEYFGNSNNNTSFELPANLLLFFKKYKPRVLLGGTR